MPDVTIKAIDDMEAIYGGLARREPLDQVLDQKCRAH